MRDYDKNLVVVLAWIASLTLLLAAYQTDYGTLEAAQRTIQICNGYLACLIVVRFLAQTFYGLSSVGGTATGHSIPQNSDLSITASEEQSQELHRRLES